MNAIDRTETPAPDPARTDSVAATVGGLAVLGLLLLVPPGVTELLESLGGPTRRLFRWLARLVDYRRYLNGGTW